MTVVDPSSKRRRLQVLGSRAEAKAEAKNSRRPKPKPKRRVQAPAQPTAKEPKPKPEQAAGDELYVAVSMSLTKETRPRLEIWARPVSGRRAYMMTLVSSKYRSLEAAGKLIFQAVENTAQGLTRAEIRRYAVSLESAA